MEDDKDTELETEAPSVWIGHNYNFEFNEATQELTFLDKKDKNVIISFTLAPFDKITLLSLLTTKLRQNDLFFDYYSVASLKKMMQRKLREIRKYLVKAKDDDKA